MGLANNTPNNAGNLTDENKPKVFEQLLEKAYTDGSVVLKELESQLCGLSVSEADARVKRYGLNEIAREKHRSPMMRLLGNHDQQT